jgi:predicted site-specific integrase-resolvase
MADNYLTLAKVAEDTGVARTTLYSHIKRGNLKTKKLGFFTVVAPSDAAAFKKRLKKVSFGDRTITIFQE